MDEHERANSASIRLRMRFNRGTLYKDGEKIQGGRYEEG